MIFVVFSIFIEAAHWLSGIPDSAVATVDVGSVGNCRRQSASLFSMNERHMASACQRPFINENAISGSQSCLMTR